MTSTSRIAVFGASGFVGGAVIDHLERLGTADVVPLIHSTGNAADLARRGRSLRIVDLLSPSSVSAALRDCTHVVNCARGGKEVLERGFQNLLEASIAAGIQRLVHVSSVAVFGDVPPGTVSEDRTPKPEKGYGANKLAQDNAVAAAVTRGLPTVVVCPPNISGPGSPFLLEIISALRSGQFGLVENGALPLELVDVDNLAHAMALALDHAVVADGRRLFVTDQSNATWKDVIEFLQPLAERGPRYQLDRADAARLAQPPAAPKVSFGKTLRHLVSSDVREALRKDPLVARTELLAKRAVKSMSPGVQSALKNASGGKWRARPAASAAVSVSLVRQQLREVRYSTAQAREVLHYTPVLTVEQSMNRFVDWYRDASGWDTDWWPLLRHLYA